MADLTTFRDAPPEGTNLGPGGRNDDAPSAAAYKRGVGTKVDQLTKFRARVKMSAKWRKDEGYEATWDRLVDLYRHKHFSEADGTDDKIAVNLSFSTINTIAPAVSVNYPTITVNARSADLEPAATAVEGAVNYWFRHFNWRKEVKRSVRDSLMIGHGWAKVWWKVEHDFPRALTDDENAQNYATANEEAGNAAETDPSLAASLPTPEEVQAQAPKTTQDVLHDEPCVDRVSPDDILIDPEATCPEDLGWIAQRMVRPLSEVKKDPAFTVAARRACEADAGTNPRWRDNDGDTPVNSGYSDEVARVTLYEFYDLRSKFYCVFAENGGDNFLLEPTDFPYPYGHPFVHLGNYDVPDQFYDIGDLEALEALQHELNAVRSDMKNHRKRYQRAYVAKRGAFDSIAEAQLQSNKDGRVIFIDDDVDLESIIKPIPQTQLDPQMYQFSDTIEADIDLVSGVSEYQRGGQSEIRRTATEANMIQDASNARSADKLSQVEDFIQEIARRVVQLAQKYLTGDHVVQVLGQDGAKQWIDFDNETIQGEFDFSVEAGSTQPHDENFKKAKAIELVNALAPYVGTTVDPTALVTYLLRDGYGVKDPQSFLMQQAPADQGPEQKLYEQINYKDAPEDIRRQMESQAGFKPSEMGGNPALDAKGADHAHQQEMQAQDQAHAQDQQAQDQQFQAEQAAQAQQAQAEASAQGATQ